jgi:coenzyme F420-0:L-glutamate ligase/coenzyme F420-1:gamma-L-glutamate ligase
MRRGHPHFGTAGRLTAMRAPALTLTALPGIPMVRPGDDLAAIVVAATREAALIPAHGDVFAVAQKVVSKAEGRYVDLATVTPSPRALELAAGTGKDPRHVEVILCESTEVLRQRKDLIIVVHRLGFIMANAGIDQSNLEPDAGERVLLLPEDPDRSAAALKSRLDSAFGVSVAVMISDSFGRAWRNGVVGVAIGAAGLPSLQNRIGAPDLAGRPLRVTEIGFADEVASAAALLMGEAAEGLPVVHIRGLGWSEPASSAASLIRPKHMDLFR